MTKFLLLDGSNLIHRAFFALPMMNSRDGLPTNAVYGFMTMLDRVLQEQEPDYLAVCFDRSRVSFRTELYPEYKGNRPAAPPELKPQFQTLMRVLQARGVFCCEEDGIEADDLIGTLSRQGEELGWEVSILSGDRDMLQLLGPHIRLLYPQKGVSQTTLWDEAAIAEHYGLSPAQIIDLKGLMGDHSDNIPGVPGVGEKTALKLLAEYQTVEGLYAGLDGMKSSALKKKLQENEALARLSKQLATIRRDLSLPYGVKDCLLHEPDAEALRQIYSELGFVSFLRQLEKTTASPAPEFSFTRMESAAALLAELPAEGELAVALLWKGAARRGTPQALGVSLADGRSFALSLENGELAALADLFADPKIRKILPDSKDAQLFLIGQGLTLAGVADDIAIAAYLVQPHSDYRPELLAAKYLAAPAEPEDDLARAALRASLLLPLREHLLGQLREWGMEPLYRDIEMRLASILAGMELAGVRIDTDCLREMSQELELCCKQLTEEIYALAGGPFNINSPKQLGELLFGKLGLPVLKKTKTGYSTDAEVLERLADEHEIVAKILEFRGYNKLKATYTDGMLPLVDEADGRLHTTFHQTVTATGRLSSTDPNLQNIPVRMAYGRRIRKAFLPAQPENRLLAADYSQIELRVLAHMAHDEIMLEAFATGQDIHARTAAEVFGVPIEQVDAEQRRRAKAVNFGIVYGISDFGLARDLQISRYEAKDYITRYFARYSAIERYLRETVERARELGYVETLLKRRRYLPEIDSRNFSRRSNAERMAMNTPIQGTAADIIKLAMLRVDEAMRAQGLRSVMILQEHDELIFDVLPEELVEMKALVKREMEAAMPLDVALLVDLAVGPNWYEMEEVES